MGKDLQQSDFVGYGQLDGIHCEAGTEVAPDVPNVTGCSCPGVALSQGNLVQDSAEVISEIMDCGGWTSFQPCAVGKRCCNWSRKSCSERSKEREQKSATTLE